LRCLAKLLEGKKVLLRRSRNSFGEAEKNSFFSKSTFLINTFEKNTLRSNFLKIDQTLIAASKCFSN